MRRLSLLMVLVRRSATALCGVLVLGGRPRTRSRRKSCALWVASGHSSLAYLTHLPLTLKIDQSFGRNIGIKPTNDAIVQTIIDMARNLALKVIAEGVETQAQQEFLARHGCTLYQSYLLDKPMPRAHFEALQGRENRKEHRLAAPAVGRQCRGCCRCHWYRATCTCWWRRRHGPITAGCWRAPLYSRGAALLAYRA